MALGAIYYYLGLHAFVLAAMLSVLEVTLSFDNAVINARVLKRMDEKWQNRFLTWGIWVAVFGTRVVLPIFIVALAAWVSPVIITMLAVKDPVAYGELLLGSHHIISAFGGAFLLMVSLKYFFNKGKDVHWIEIVEERLTRWGRVEAVEIALALCVLLGISYVATGEHVADILTAGIFGIVLFILMEGVTQALGASAKLMEQTGLFLFLYLNVLDTAFSLDGVVGAFALSSNIFVIATGLGIGAFFVRTITIYLVRKHILEAFIYLEHGAHWAILGLSGAMLASLVIHVPGVLIGGIGLCFILLSFWSSQRNLKKHIHAGMV